VNIVIVIKLLGIVFALLGVAYLLKPQITKRLIGFFKKGRRMYLPGLVRFILAVVFFVGAGQCRYFWIIFAFGILFLISGLLIFVLGPAKMRRILDWYEKQPLFIFRVIAVVVVAVGVIIVFSA
jgi:uncharacterized protein YjeT (DUF2065 family)